VEKPDLSFSQSQRSHSASFLARDVICTSRAYATMSVSVCLSVTEVHWRIIANLWFQIPIPIYRALRSRCMRARGKWSSPGRVEGSSRAMQPLLGALVNMSNFVCDIEHGHWLTGHCMIWYSPIFVRKINTKFSRRSSVRHSSDSASARLQIIFTYLQYLIP